MLNAFLTDFTCRRFSPYFLSLVAISLGGPVALRAALPAPTWEAFLDKHCVDCHNDIDKEGGLDLGALTFDPGAPVNFQTWVKIHDRIEAGEMPPKKKARPETKALTEFVGGLTDSLTAAEKAAFAQEGRAVTRRLNRAEYENALRDLFKAPWLQVQGQLPEDGEAYRFNKSGEALSVSHVHMARFMTAADYAIRQAMTTEFTRPPTRTRRYYARDQLTLTSKFTQNAFNTSPDRQTYPLIGREAQPDVRALKAPLTVGPADPAKRNLEAVGWVSSNYVTGFTYRWDGFRAPVAGRYHVSFSGFTAWVPPGGFARRFANGSDPVGESRPPQKHVPNYDQVFPGRRTEPITVYTRNGIMNRRVGEFDLTTEPAVHDIGEVWLLANETLVPDASRFYRSRPNNFRNPLMQEDGAPSVAFRWMEVEGPLYDESTTAGYRLLFGELPLQKSKKGGVILSVAQSGGPRDATGRNAGQRVQSMIDVAVEVVTSSPIEDSERLLRGFMASAYRRPVAEGDVQRFLSLIRGQLKAGLSFTQAMVAGYTAVLSSPRFAFVDEESGRLDDLGLAMRLSLFLTNSTPDAKLHERAARGELHRPEVLRAETERLLASPESTRFVDAFVDYWLDLRKIEDSTPSTTLYNDYYLDDALTEAAQAETRLTFTEMLAKNLPTRTVVDSDFIYVNDRLATHYGLKGIEGIAMRRVTLPPDSVRGGFLTQASVLKLTANGTTTSPVLRGKWIAERILGQELRPPPAVPAIEPDIRGAVTIRQQLDKHRADESCASCHRKIDPPGFALESFDIMGAWRDRYRGIAESENAVKGLGKNGQPFSFYYALPVDAAGELADGRTFHDVREYKKLLASDERMIARSLASQLVVYATGAPIAFSDRPELERILSQTAVSGYGIRSLIHSIIQSELFLNK